MTDQQGQQSATGAQQQGAAAGPQQQQAGAQQQQGQQAQQGGQGQQQATGQQGAQGQQQGGQQQPGPEVKVPVSVVQALRDENRGMKEKVQTLTTQLQILQQGGFHFGGGQQQQQPAGQSQQPQQQLPDDPFRGLEDDDTVTVADIKKALKSGAFGGGGGSGAQQPAPGGGPQQFPGTSAAMEQFALMGQDPNYQQVIMQNLPNIVNTIPGIIPMVRQSPQPLTTLYSLAKVISGQGQQAGGGQQQANPSDPTGIIDQLIAAVSQTPGSPSQFGGGGVGAGGGDRYKTMSDDEFEAHKQRVISGRT